MFLSARNSKVIELVHDVSHNDMSQPSPPKDVVFEGSTPVIGDIVLGMLPEEVVVEGFRPVVRDIILGVLLCYQSSQGFSPVVGHIIREYFQKRLSSQGSGTLFLTHIFPDA